MPPFTKAGFDKDPNYQKVSGVEARNVAANYGRAGAIVNKGDYWIIDGNVYRYTSEYAYAAPRSFSQVESHPVTDWDSYKSHKPESGGETDIY